MTNMNSNFELSLNDLDAVTGGDKCAGTGTCPNNGQGDHLGQLRQIESGLIDAG
jgi:hypothetical protein